MRTRNAFEQGLTKITPILDTSASTRRSRSTPRRWASSRSSRHGWSWT